MLKTYLDFFNFTRHFDAFRSCKNLPSSFEINVNRKGGNGYYIVLPDYFEDIEFVIIKKRQN